MLPEATRPTLDLPLDTLATGLLALSISAAVSYGLGMRGRPVSMARTLVKTLAVGALAALMVYWQAPVLLIAGLALGALGDGLLAGERQARFLAGLVAFLASHLAYVGLFHQLGAPQVHAQDLRFLAVFACVLGAGEMLRHLWKGLGALRVAVIAYFLAIVSMGVLAWTLPLASGWGVWIVAAGASLFLISDAVLGLEQFRLAPGAPARAWTGQLVWWSYYLGQVLIAFGVLALPALR